MPDTIDDAQEHPIIFNDWSINRILAGEKTQTRRICVHSQIANKGPDAGWWPVETPDEVNTPFGDEEPLDCPYGQPGDVLWVREAFRMPVGCDDKYTPKEYISSSGYTQGVPGRFRYEADEKRAYEVAGNRDACAVEWGRLRPAIHMPRELCRLRLRVEDVRVEQLTDISAADVEAEGIDLPEEARGYSYLATQHFEDVWNDIHGEGAWERNDWVWVIEFARCDE